VSERRLLGPDRERAVRRSVVEVPIRGEQCQVVPDAELRDERIDRP
jgi:hypothetical protein